MGFLKGFAKQFEMPKGFGGKIAGFLMSNDTKKSEWAISLLKPNKKDRVLEVGVGPGIAIKLLSEKITEGFIAGIDISELMLRTASKKNKEAIAKGIVDLRLANVSTLPPYKGKFDKILAVNTIMFWENPVNALKNLRNVTRQGGKIIITVQPRMKGANDRTVKEFGKRIHGYLKEAGYSEIQIHIKEMKPISCVCITGINSSRYLN